MNENILDTKYSTEDDKLIVTRSQDVQAILDACNLWVPS